MQLPGVCCPSFVQADAQYIPKLAFLLISVYNSVLVGLNCFVGLKRLKKDQRDNLTTSVL